ncbi:MAG: transglutaminase domain-containing protein [Ruminococcus sp.]|nr:transglutaminase domain-containing protein [Ruminococcus sp.]
MKQEKTRNTERGIIDPHGIIIEGDIAMSHGLDPGEDRMMFLRVLIAALSSFFTIWIFCGFLNLTTILYIFPVIMVTLSFAALRTKNGALKTFAIGYFIFQLSYFGLKHKAIYNGINAILYEYFKKADVNDQRESFWHAIKNIPKEELDPAKSQAIMLIGALVAAMVALGLILRFDFPIQFVSTFPLVEVGLFHGWDPPTLPAIGLVICWIAVLAVSIINHATNKAGINNTFAVHRRKKAFYFTSGRLKRIFFSYYLMCIAFVCAAVFTVSVLFSSITGFVRPEPFTKMREEITDFLRGLPDDIADFFNDLFSSDVKKVGATSGGKLGDRDKLEFSGDTALNLNILRKTDYTLYLRGFVAGDYGNNEWVPIKDKLPDNVRDLLNQYGENTPAQNFNKIMCDQAALSNNSTISIALVDADDRFVYAPYFADYLSANTQEETKIIAEGEGSVNLDASDNSYKMDFCEPVTNAFDWCSNRGIIDLLCYNNYTMGNQLNVTYSTFVNDNYTAVSDTPTLNKVFNDIKNNYIFDQNYKEYYNSELICFGAIKDYFDINGFKYDKAPGKTPDGVDFIENFLTTKKGYCTYFASAGAMLMRKFGFPARYVEGYVVTPKDYEPGKDSPYSAKVTDKAAHAWCEVFIDGIGWVPLEFTPGFEQGGNPNDTDPKKPPETTTPKVTTVTTPKQSGPATTATDKNGDPVVTTTVSTGKGGDRTGTGTHPTATVGDGDTYNNPIFNVFKTMLYYVPFILVMIAVFIINRKTRKNKQHKLITQEDYGQAVLAIYLYFLKYLALIGITEEANITDEEQAKRLIEKCHKHDIDTLDQDIMKLFTIAIEAHLSRSAEITKDEYMFARLALSTVKNEIAAPRLSFIGRFAAKWLYGLY